MHDDLFGLVLTVSVIGFLCVVGHFKGKIRELRERAVHDQGRNDLEIMCLKMKIRQLETELAGKRD